MKQKSILIVFGIAFALTTFWSAKVSAHSDGLDGPVVKTAQKALESGNANLVIIWVKKADEAELKRAFQNV